ncbi:MAG TPA: elongation factor 3 [Rhodobacteraceae bacterium]|jgi:ATP-binding cassette subfamily F protein uup|nr:ATP-binding cassette domain-containing protein [Paracoccaceae bacterium]HBG99089.1 elongation factor 3 [Paracoccaceae bacterium]
MSRAPLLQLTGVTLGFGGRPLFDALDLTLHPGERLALIGRNGAGKSTLMRVIAGLLEPDAGRRAMPPGTVAGYLEQEPDFTGFASLGAYAAAGLAPGEAWRVERAGEGLHLALDRPPEAASGGERRRAALVRLLAGAPDLMLLDEPTNHLDIAAIAWLEAELARSRAAIVLISHDRAFLHGLAQGVLWLDRGELRRRDGGFDGFEAWREQVWEAEATARYKLDRKIRAEARWAVEGISARRRRNQGRLRALADLRAERAAMVGRPGTAALALSDGARSGKRAIEADGIAKRFGDTQVIADFSIRILRGDRIAIVGPNGVGKTTLVRLLTGELAPDRGQVRHGTGLEVAVFDQNRAALDPEATLWESLTGDPAMRLPGRADQVMVRGQPRHVVAYLKDFLFDEAQARAPVRSLSGGEKARLLLARIMARESNLLVLDEPTNDLDIETLDLLQEVLDGYPGTVLLVSHDRDFIDRVATATVLMEGQGRAVAYAGGWTDMVAQRGAPPLGADPEPVRTAKPAGRAPRESRPTRRATGLTLPEADRLKKLPDAIDRLETEIAKLEQALSDPGLYGRAPETFGRASAALADRRRALTEAEEEWLLLAEKAEAAGDATAQ